MSYQLQRYEYFFNRKYITIGFYLIGKTLYVVVLYNSLVPYLVVITK